MGIIQSLFGRKPKQQNQISVEWQNSFSSFTGSAFNSATFRTAVDAIGRHVAKLSPHAENNRLEKLLTTSPNAYMTTYDLLYKLCVTYYTTNNAWLLIDRSDTGEISGLYPLTPNAVEFQQDQTGQLLVMMRFADGRELLQPYSNIVHLRRHFFNDELLGDTNIPLYDLLDVSDTLRQGVSQSIKNGTSLRGILKFQSIIQLQQMKDEKDRFVKDYLALSNTGGIAATDMKFDFVPTNTQYSIPKDVIQVTNEQIYAYLGISEKIVNGLYSEDNFSAFFESVIEPFALQLSLEFSRKCGASVTFTSERLEFSSSRTKIALLRQAAPLGILSVNEARKLLALPEVEDGDKRLQSLNFVNADKADEYQKIEESEE